VDAAKQAGVEHFVNKSFEPIYHEKAAVNAWRDQLQELLTDTQLSAKPQPKK
jgi:hypothetical protein